MAIPESPIPPAALLQFQQQMLHLIEATKAQVAATLASGIIAASGKPHSIQQAMDIVRDIQFALYPAHGSGAYMAWEANRDDRLNKVHGPS